MQPHQWHRIFSPLSRPPSLSDPPHSFKCPQAKLSVDRLVGEPRLPVEHRPVRHAVEERPERGVATSVVVIFKHRPGLDGNGNDAIGLEPVRRPGETSRRALWDFFQ